jgi:SPP1 family predicted phage head-tail adaptor
MREPLINRLRRRLVIEVPVEMPDGAGGVSRDFAPRDTVWGAVKTATGQTSAERERAGRGELGLRHSVTLRWRPDLDGTMRLRDGERLYAIIGVADPDGQRRLLVCLVEEVTP